MDAKKKIHIFSLLNLFFTKKKHIFAKKYKIKGVKKK